MRSRHSQKSPPPDSISPRSSRWNAWLWTLAKPGIVQPLSIVASWGANVSSSTDLMRPPSTSMSTFSARRPIHACSACHFPEPFNRNAHSPHRGEGWGEGLHLPLPAGERGGERGRRSNLPLPAGERAGERGRRLHLPLPVGERAGERGRGLHLPLPAGERAGE